MAFNHQLKQLLSAGRLTGKNYFWSQGVPPVFQKDSSIVSFYRNKRKIYPIKNAAPVESSAKGVCDVFDYFYIS
jgi:hypothetical protein